MQPAAAPVAPSEHAAAASPTSPLAGSPVEPGALLDSPATSEFYRFLNEQAAAESQPAVRSLSPGGRALTHSQAARWLSGHIPGWIQAGRGLDGGHHRRERGGRGRRGGDG